MDNISDKNKELFYLFQRTALILEFMTSKSPDIGMSSVKDILIQTFEKKNLIGLRTMSRDVNEWARGLKPEDIKELELLLKERFEEDLSGDKVTHQILNEVIKKNIISNKEEYRVVYEYLQSMDANDPFFSKRKDLERSLSNWGMDSTR